MQYKRLYFVILLSLILLILFSLGSGFWGGSDLGLHWTEKLFFGVCHQIPDRTFSVNGNPMAVNTRCFGVFTGLLLGWFLIPVVRNRFEYNQWPLLALSFAVMLQIIDYSGNLMQLWENTNQSRALFGLILGLTGPIVIAELFYTKT